MLCEVIEKHPALMLRVFSMPIHGLASSHPFSLHVEGKMELKRYNITTEQTVSLPTDKSTSLSTHGSHSDTQSSPQGTPME